MDNGYPQNTSPELLKEYIKSESYSLADVNKGKLVIPENENIMRSANLFYKKNECFMDVIEKLNMTVTSTGQVIKSEVLGKLQLKTQLSGIPTLKLGLNDKAVFEATGKNTANSVELEDVKFH